MQEKHEFFVNTALLLVIGLLVAYLIKDVQEARNQVDEIEETYARQTQDFNDEERINVAINQFDEELYQNVDRFRPIITPVPTQTPIPIPTPTPAPPPFAEHWQIISIMGNVVQIRDVHGKMHYKSVGESLEQVEIIAADSNAQQVRVRNEADGREKLIPVMDQRRNTGRRR